MTVDLALGIEARGLAKRFGAREAVRPFDAVLAPGEVTGLLGPNGSGKSTFLRMLLGLVRPDAGRARLAGVALKGDGVAVRRRVASMPGESAAYLELKGGRHLAWLCRGRDRATLARAVAVAGELGLPLDVRVRAYSHGMKRMLLLAACLAPDVPVRVLDEPTEGLDPTRRAQVLDLLEAEARAGRCVLLSSHHLGEVERACARLLFLHRGERIADERADDLRARARRLVRIEWPPEVALEPLAPRLAALGARAARVAGRSIAVELADADPRPFLAALGAARDLPAPRAIAAGAHSLADLYRDLYGVEGV